MARPKKTMASSEAADVAAQESGGIKEVEITSLDQLAVYEKEGKLVGWSGFGEDGKGIAKVLASLLLMFACLFGRPAFAAVDPTDEAVLGNNRWSVQSDGDLVPATDDSYDIGASTAEVDNLYVKTAIYLNGSSYTSFAAGTDGNWTDNGADITLDRAPTKFIATVSSGDFFATGFTVGTGDFTFANGAKLDGDTANEIRLIENSDTLKIGFNGNDITVDSTDGGVIFALTDATDGTVDFQTNNDTDDYIQISTTTNQPLINFVGSNGKITAASGSIDFDNENLTTTGTLSSGATTVTSLIIGDETFSVPTDDTIRIASNDAQTIWDVYTPGTSDEDAVLRLSADASADSGDDWQVVSDGGTNSLLFQNDTSGSQATILTLANTGLITTTGDVVVAGTTPLVTVGDAGAEDTGVKFDGNAQDYTLGLDDTDDTFQLVLGSALGTTPLFTSTSAGVITLTGSTDGDLTVYGAGATASDAYLRLVGDAGADASDRWQFWNDSSAGTLYIQSDITVAGTYVTLASVDANGDWVYSGTTPRLTIGDAGEEDASVVFDGNAQDFAIGLDDSADKLVVSLGSALGTTNRMAFNSADLNIVIGDASAADVAFIFDGNAQDFSVGMDDSADKLTIALGSVLGTTNRMAFNSADLNIVLGDATAADVGFIYDGNAQDYNISLDDSTDDLVIGLGSAAGTTDALRIDENQDVTVVQDLLPLSTITGDGGGVLVGMLQSQVASTTTTVTAAQAGVSFVSDSADVMTLPEASTVLGARYTFIAGTADDFDINPNDATDTILPITASGGTITPAAGDAIRITDAGASVTLEAIGANSWACVAHNGAITDVN